MPEPIVIRAERPDHPQVVALLSALDAYLATLYAPEANHILGVDELLAQKVHFLVASQGDAIVGCGATRLMPGEPETGGEGYGEIKRMYVSPSHRGDRIGARLLQALEDELLQRGVHLALLETGAEQTQAVRLYERAGYTLRGPFGGYPYNGLSLFYAKVLD